MNGASGTDDPGVAVPRRSHSVATRVPSKRFIRLGFRPLPPGRSRTLTTGSENDMPLT